MWSHYADNHRGVVIGVELPENQVAKVRYVERLNRMPGMSPNDKARRLLSRKHVAWGHEQEYRVIVTGRKFVSVKPVEIILGVETPIQMERLILKLVDRISSNAKVVWMKKVLLDVNESSGL